MFCYEIKNILKTFKMPERFGTTDMKCDEPVLCVSFSFVFSLSLRVFVANFPLFCH